MPIGACRSTNSRASAMSRAAGTITGTPSGNGASSSTRTKRSSTRRQPLTSCIDPLLERFDADTGDRVDEQFFGPLAQLEIGGGDILHHVGDLPIGHRWSENLAELGVLAGAAADRHLIVLLA